MSGPLDNLWRTAALGQVAIAGLLASYAHPTYGPDAANLKLPSLYDLPEALMYAAAICVVRYFAEATFKPLGRAILSPKKRIQPDRVERFASVTFKFCYYCFITAAGWYLMGKEDWFPPVLGGTGETVNCFKGHPDQNLPDETRTYYLLQLGYHCHSLLYLAAFSSKRNDFWEMTVHHIATILLMAFSYLFNFVRIGSLVVFVHDIGDVTGYFIKAVVDTGHKVATLVSFVLLLVSWGYTRLYALPFFITHSAATEAYLAHEQYHGFVSCAVALLVMLQLLHCYWYGLFIQMGLNVAKKDEIEDIQQKCKDTTATTASVEDVKKSS